MAKEARCADVGMDCGLVTRAETQDELMDKVARHAEEAHGIRRSRRGFSRKSRA